MVDCFFKIVVQRGAAGLKEISFVLDYLIGGDGFAIIFNF
jgi:hypothetical protein